MKKKILLILFILIKITLFSDIIDMQIIIDDPNIVYNSEKYFDIAITKLVDLNLYKQAQNYIDEAKQIYPENISFDYYDELISILTENTENQEKILERIINKSNLDKFSEDYFIERSSNYTSIHKIEIARNILLEAEKNFPQSSQIKHLLGRNAMDLGLSLDTEIEYYTQAIARNPNIYKYFFDRAGAYNAANMQEESTIDYQICIDNGYKESDAYNCIAMNYSAVGDDEKAIEAYKKSIELDPENISSYTNLSNIYRTQGELDTALKIIEEGLKIDQHNYFALVNLGQLYEVMEKPQEAIKIYTLVIEEHPAKLYGWYFRGKLYHKLGESEKADKDIAEARRINGN